MILIMTLALCTQSYSRYNTPVLPLPPFAIAPSQGRETAAFPKSLPFAGGPFAKPRGTTYRRMTDLSEPSRGSESSQGQARRLKPFRVSTSHLGTLTVDSDSEAAERGRR